MATTLNRRVLLIDDDSHVLSALLRRLGDEFDLTTATGGRVALDLVEAAASPFAVVVCDMHMPGMDGIETLRAVQDRSPDTVPIMMTGTCEVSVAVAAINRGHIFRFYVKPVDAADLAEGVRAGLRQHALFALDRQLVEQEERWRLALEAAGDGVWDWAPQTGAAVFSSGWLAMLGLSAEPLPERIEAWWNRIHPEDRDRVSSEITRLLDGDDPVLQCEHRLRDASGAFLWIRARGSVLTRAADGRAIRVIGTHSDVSAHHRMADTLRRQAEELERLATLDSLTGLWNRRQFLAKAEEELHRAERYGRSLSVVMVDIDHFKRVNDQHGHAAGDAVLQAFAEVLAGRIRKTDRVGRLGGEEFAVLLAESDAADACVVAETLRRAVAETMVTIGDGLLLSVTASFGVAAARHQGDSIAALLHRADEALYQAKDGGRNQIRCHPERAERTNLTST